MIFWNSAEITLVFCQCKRSLQSRRYYSGFWSRGTWPSAESPDRGPRRNAHYTCTVKGREKSRMRTTYQNSSMRFGFFANVNGPSNMLHRNSRCHNGVEDDYCRGVGNIHKHFYNFFSKAHNILYLYHMKIILHVCMRVKVNDSLNVWALVSYGTI